MEPVNLIRSRTAVLPYDDIDTDQIIPARFLTTTTRDGLGEAAFADWRYDSQGNPEPGFVLNTPEARDCAILVTGSNFGCGSSREHAAWALAAYGFRAVVSPKIADIFRSNALKNGLLPVVVDPPVHQWLVDNPGAEVEIDLERRRLRLPDGHEAEFPVDSFSRYCLLNGTDQLGFLQQHTDAIERFERDRSWQP